MEKKKIPWKKGLSALWEILAVQRKGIGLIVLLGIVSAVADAFVPLLIGRFFDSLSESVSVGALQAGVLITFATWLLIQIIATLIGWYDSHVAREVYTRMHLILNHKGLTHLLRLPIGYHKQERIADILEAVSRAGWMCTGAVQNISRIAPQLLSVVVGIGIAFTLNSYLALFLVLGAAVYSVILALVVSNAGEVFRVGHESWNRAWGDVSSSVQQIDAVKASAAEEYEEARARKAFFDDALKPWMKMENIWSYTNLYQRIVILVVQSSILFISIWLVLRGALTIGELIAFNGYALMFLGPFVSFGHSWQSMQNGVISAARLKENVLDMTPENYHPVNATYISSIKGDVTFDGVSFRYADATDHVLKDISFQVSAGETVAFVGESGVGKSTLISLILAFYHPTEGQILVDGEDTARVSLTNLRSQMAVVPQEVALFNDSVETNIKYGSFSASRAEVERAAKLARADEFISRLPNGYDTVVGERGVKLSVGQKQRIAVARAILRDPKILILDEPTSALDSRTEKELTESLEKLMEGRTTFIIAHRLSTVRKADKIIVIEEGRAAEIGTHAELIQKENGRYRVLYEHHIGLHE